MIIKKQAVRKTGAGSPDDQREQFVESLVELADQKYSEAERFVDLPGWLDDAGRRVQEMRIARFKDIHKLRDDPKIVELQEKIRVMHEALEAEDEEKKKAEEDEQKAKES